MSYAKQIEKNEFGRLYHYVRQQVMGYTNKQIVSEFEMAAADKNFTKERWLEKITDIVCYQYLLLAVLEDTDEFKKE